MFDAMPAPVSQPPACTWPRLVPEAPAVATAAEITAAMRRRRLVARLRGLAEDAMLEGCENAAQVLRDAVASLLTAAIDDAWRRHDAA